MTAVYGPSLISLPEALDRASVQRLASAIERIWMATLGAPPAELRHDLTLLRRWFDPVAQGQRLRRELAAVPAIPPDVVDPGFPFTLRVGDHKSLVTPEGRCALDLLGSIPDQATAPVTDLRLLYYDRLLGQLYREWSRHRLESVVALLSGSDKPLQVPAAGVVVALLVNRCTDERRALVRFASGSAREVVDQAFFSTVQAFADVLAPRRRVARTSPRLLSGWMLYEARRRLGTSLVLEDARTGQDGRVWIRSDAQDHVVDIVCRDLSRSRRPRVTLPRFAEAFDALVAALRRGLPRLAGFGLGHERPSDTQTLRDRFLDGLAHQLGVR